MALKKSLKYIKFVGYIDHLAGCTGDENVVTYDNVRLVDESGQHLEVNKLITPTLLERHLVSNKGYKESQKMTMYMLRYHNARKKQYFAALYALEVDGQKYYYEDVGMEAASAVALLSSSTMSLLGLGVHVAALVAAAAFFGSVFLGQLIGGVFGEIGKQYGMIAGGAACLWWLLRPMVSPRKYARVSELKGIMRNEGFQGQVMAPSAKY